MSFRSCIAILILANYLWLAGYGYISRPEESPYMLRVQTTVSGLQERYEECRYLRMDGLESFIQEALVTRYQDAPDATKHHIFSIISSIDAHFLPEQLKLLVAPFFRYPTATAQYLSPGLRDVILAVYSPPE